MTPIIENGIHNLDQEKADYIMQKRVVKPKDAKEYCLFVQKEEEKLSVLKEKWQDLGTKVREKGQEIPVLKKNLMVLVERMR